MKYSLALFLLGATLIYLGASKHGAWLLLAWPGANFAALGIGYLGIGAKVLGKGKAGRIPAWSKVFYFPFLIYTKIVWHTVRLLSREAPFNQVCHGIIIGRRLLPSEVPADITNYVDVTAEFEEPLSVRESVNYICLPILDGFVPTPGELKAALSQVRDGNTYIHCAQGHGRTGIFTLALLAEKGAVKDSEEGLLLLKKSRPALALNSLQSAFVQRYLKGAW